MKTSYLFAITSLLLLFSTTMAAQETIPAAGGDASGSSGTANYSVGQVFYNTNTDPATGSEAQGVQQPYEISEITGLWESITECSKISVYPNPVTDFITLEIENFEKTDYGLYDMNGKLILSQKCESNETFIVMENLPSATYILVVSDSNQTKTFQIIKN
ncbi:MAG: hypothetical protein CVU11_10780 [Bacteroidetes bacterium HGW-Bacteroidetes-6]|jgi:opacity protein-like surface antigen|nr:MAG: hypothetical protein CVU11_10780 [Bacteroidetes bacterium HGW-Bacteroidetes-6]